jgi:DNA polymerase/3'-5' exonuclease PolX
MINQLIIDNFKKLIHLIELETYNLTNKEQITLNHFRINKLKNALNIITKLKIKIINSDQITNIKGIGKGTIKRVNEICKTGQLAELANYDTILKKSEKTESIISDLMKVIGIGRILAIKLMQKYKIKSAIELKKLSDSGKIQLNDKLKIGIKYLNNFQGLIPHSEIDLIYDHLQTLTHKYNPLMFITICGSYRRELSTSSDIDVLLSGLNIMTNEEINLNLNILSSYINYLHKELFLIDDITNKNIITKYMGFCKLNSKSIIRRIDIRLIPFISYYPALLYFTGSYEFNHEIRALAKKLGYKLNEYGLYDNNNNMIFVLSEQDIFEKLGMKYLLPNQR